MKCLNCGRETDGYLCGSCRTEPILYNVFYSLLLYNPEKETTPYIKEYVSSMTEKYEERGCIPQILDLFDEEIAAYYYCRYYRVCRDPRFEETAKHYLAGHPHKSVCSQNVIHDLLESYQLTDYIAPRQWCEWIGAEEDLACDLYADAGKYFGMIGEYDAADAVLDKALACCADPAYDLFLRTSREGMLKKVEDRKKDILRYRTKRPYWPKTEERRRAVAMFYDEKGIKYPRIESKPAKVAESEFEPLHECYDDGLTDYCAFWCAETFGMTAAKCIYQIAAVKVRGGRIADEFQSLIRPWDGTACRKDAARKAKLDLSVIESAEDVDQVMGKFFAFAGDDVLVSTGALGNQGKLIIRAARYAGMKEIPNAFCDLLDLAEDNVSGFAVAGREQLLAFFGIEEGADSLEKARANQKLYEAIRNFEG